MNTLTAYIKKMLCAGFIMPAALLFPILAFSQNDTIILKNKDRLIGEIKEMNKGVLQLETDYSDEDFKVKWVDIAKLSSNQVFLINLTDGERINSKLATDTINGGRVVLNDINTGETIYTTVNEIVYVKSVKQGFFSRLDASVSFGLSYTKSSSLKQLNVRSNIGYTANYWRLSGSYNAVRSSQTDTEEVKRTDADVSFRYFLEHDNFLMVSSEFLSNDEQLLKLRVTTKGGFGHYFVHTNKMYFGGMGGIAWNNETFYDSPEGTRNSVEAFVGAELNMFDIEDFSLLTNATAYPSLTEKDRIRADFKIDLKYDLPLDFFIKFGLTYNFDSKPVEGAAKDDYVFQTTFGWEL